MREFNQVPYDYNFKYFNNLLGYWIEEDNGHKSFIFDVDGPYFKSYVRLVTKNKIHKKTFYYIIIVDPNGWWTTIIVWEGSKGHLKPSSVHNDTPTERLLRMYSYSHYPKLKNEITQILQREQAYQYAKSLMSKDYKIYL